MLTHTQVMLSRDTAQVAPGESAEVLITVTNQSNIVDVYSVDVLGLPRGWAHLSVSTISLFPGDQGACTLTIAPPKDSAARADTYPFSVNVVSRKDPTQAARAEGSIDLLAFDAVGVSLSPESAKGPKGNFSMVISNAGNEAVKFDLEASDPKGLFVYRFDPLHPRVEAGKSQTVQLVVEAKARGLRKPVGPAQFQVSVAPERSGTAPSIAAAMVEVTPRLPRWALPAALAVVAIVVLGIALAVFLTRPSWDVDSTLDFMDRRVSETVPMHHFVPFDLPGAMPATIEVNTEWRTGGPESLHLVLLTSDGRCQRTEERSDSDPVIFNLAPGPANWQEPCTHLSYLGTPPSVQGWGVAIENHTEFQARDVRTQIAFVAPAQ